MPPRRRPPRAGALTELPPLRLLSQIALLQLLFYVSATFLILFTTLVAGKPFTLSLVLSWHSIRGDTTVGWMLGLVWMLNAFVSVIALLIIVSRSKLILDFAVTIHVLHLCAVAIYTGAWPWNALWWGLQVASTGLMVGGGVWSCRRRELAPIKFGARDEEGGEGGEGYELVGKGVG